MTEAYKHVDIFRDSFGLEHEHTSISLHISNLQSPMSSLHAGCYAMLCCGVATMRRCVTLIPANCCLTALLVRDLLNKLSPLNGGL